MGKRHLQLKKLHWRCTVKISSMKVPAFINKKVVDKGAALLCEPVDTPKKKRKTT